MQFQGSLYIKKRPIEEDDVLSVKICYRCQESAIVSWEFIEKMVESERAVMEFRKKIMENIEDEVMCSTDDAVQEFEIEEHLMEPEEIENHQRDSENEDVNEIFNDDYSDGDHEVESEAESDRKIHENTDFLPIIIENNELNYKNSPESPPRTFHCSSCPESFPSQLLLNFHVVKHDSSKKQRKVEKVNEAIQSSSFQRDRDGRFICHICQGKYRTRDNLSRHIVKHSSEKNFKCEICPREFYFQRDLNVHVKQHSKNSTLKFTCSECRSEYTTSSALKKHSLVHKNERNFKCDRCNLGFKTKGTLQNHYRIHSGEKPFVCVRCSKAFTQKNILQRHMTKVHDEFIYGCEWCNFSFEKHGELREHWRECENLKNRGKYEVIFVTQDGSAISLQDQNESTIQNVEVGFAED